MTSDRFETDRLVMRRPAEADLEAMFEMMSNVEAMRFWSTLPHADRGVTVGWLARIIDRNAHAGGEDFVIEFEGRVIGFVGAGQLPEFGFMLRRDHWGRGFAAEAARGFVSYAFAELGRDHLTADVDPRNAASLRLLERLGFSVTGTAERTFLLGEEWCDSVYLRLDRFAG